MEERSIPNHPNQHGAVHIRSVMCNDIADTRSPRLHRPQHLPIFLRPQLRVPRTSWHATRYLYTHCPGRQWCGCCCCCCQAIRSYNWRSARNIGTTSDGRSRATSVSIGWIYGNWVLRQPAAPQGADAIIVILYRFVLTTSSKTCPIPHSAAPRWNGETVSCSTVWGHVNVELVILD